MFFEGYSAPDAMHNYRTVKCDREVPETHRKQAMPTCQKKQTGPSQRSLKCYGIRPEGGVLVVLKEACPCSPRRAFSCTWRDRQTAPGGGIFMFLKEALLYGPGMVLENHFWCVWRRRAHVPENNVFSCPWRCFHAPKGGISMLVEENVGIFLKVTFSGARRSDFAPTKNKRDTPTMRCSRESLYGYPGKKKL